MAIRIGEISHFLAEQCLQILACARELGVKRLVGECRQVGVIAGMEVEAESLPAQFADVRGVSPSGGR